MKFHPTEILSVYLNLNREKKRVGRMAMKDRRIYFEYDESFIASKIELSPFKLPLKNGAQSCDDLIFDGLFGLFNDSLPDGWGRLLLDRQVEKFGINRGQLSPLDRLSFVGAGGMGALSYEPELSSFEEKNEILNLDHLAKEAKIVLESESQEVFEDLLRLNGSSSGARPKVLAQMGQKEWMIKFPSSMDAKDIGPIEYAYSLMAKKAGILMPETQLFKAKKNSYFCVQRFDRVANGRVHMHSLCGLIHADHHVPSLDYDLILKVAQILTKNIQQVEYIFRLACFNVFAHNRDDHSKNFSFILDEALNWQLSPAYDLTFSYGPGGEQSSTVMGEGKAPSLRHLIELGKKYDIKHAKHIIDEVRTSVSKWESFAKMSGVSTVSAKKIKAIIG